MNREIMNIHHVGHVVTNREAAMEHYRRLGLNVHRQISGASATCGRDT
ncbi:hypothetical protein I6N90_13310 [Paenibacillus sp. GSMTC-2017]|nr:hypothetical protein [Paenibacillus sp. GSMTC-2017]MBH5318779.1 hypothetical protein [Paenibacillus sp. GSMTC-2017]